MLFKSQDVQSLDAGVSAASIGFVMQNPDHQLVTDKVWHELAFGLENLNTDPAVIRRAVAEISGYFGIDPWFEKNVDELSGGQKQLLNLAAVMVMRPEILILDEPTSQLDPIAASDFLAAVKRLNTDYSLTVIIAEHRLEEVLTLSDRMLVLEDGELICDGGVREVCREIAKNDRFFNFLPVPSRVCAQIESEDFALTVREGRSVIEKSCTNEIKSPAIRTPERAKTAALEMKDVFFRYSRELDDVLRGLCLEVRENEIFCILGGNGSGKSTALMAASGIIRTHSGSIRVFGKKLKHYKNNELYKGCLAMLGQDVQTLFLKNTVREELEDSGITAEELPFDLSALLNKHPYDLSGGEQQLLGIAKVLASKPRILLLDEPTKGLDPATKKKITAIIKQLKSDGMTVVCVTHDVEFAAETAERCALFFRGDVTCTDEPHAFFEGSSFYTTAANRMTRDFFSGVITAEEAAELCRKNRRNAND